MAASDWPHYRRILADYEKYSRSLNSVLYRMCEEMPTHDEVGHIWAKVWIIGRTYATGIERHAEDGLDDIVNAIRRAGRWLDPGLEKLRQLGVTPKLEYVPAITQLHGRLQDVISEFTRGENGPRSFVSKYLHFHARVVPIYDSRASTQIRHADWYRWQRSWEGGTEVPTKADEEYWRFCVRIGRMAQDWMDEGLEPSARNLDTYLIRYRDYVSDD